MREQLWMVGVLNVLVNLLLLMAANRLCGQRPGFGRCLLASAVGGIYAAGCLLPGFGFLNHLIWRMVILCVQGMLAFDLCSSAVRRTLVYLLLSMALGGLSGGLKGDGYGKVLLAALTVSVLSMAALRAGSAQGEYMPVLLKLKEKTLELTALRDTGNSLCDPVTGESVLILGADAAKELVGLDRKMLRDPVGTLAKEKIRGMRLIPYHTVGQNGGMLLAMRMDSVRIGGAQAGTLVAFAPEGLDREGRFQALAGGMI